jgi:hypothetical protein
MFWRVVFPLYFFIGQALGMPVIDIKADTTSVTLGQPLGLEIELEYPLTFDLLSPDLRLVWSDFQFTLTELTGPIIIDDRQQVFLRGNIQFFELGQQTIPPIAFIFLDSKMDTVLSESSDLTVSVNSVLMQNEQEIRDIKPPVYITGGVSVWLVLVITVVLFAVIGMLVFLGLRRYRRRTSHEEDKIIEVDFIAEFNRIAQMGLLEKGEIKLYYSLLSDNLRKFLENRWVEEAMEKTTGEIENILRKQNIDNDLIRRTGLYLSTADLVKFARFHPDIDNANHAPRLGLAILHSFEKSNEEQEGGRLQTVKE